MTSTDIEPNSLSNLDEAWSFTMLVGSGGSRTRLRARSRAFEAGSCPYPPRCVSQRTLSKLILRRRGQKEDVVPVFVGDRAICRVNRKSSIWPQLGRVLGRAQREMGEKRRVI
mmetsp:Transcript_68767/g.223977  ORF Transcript_68767/g.223977 Transcript_68767/m.223977 type:complete len:113 (-) Transcript_68767:61-399(-)